MITQLSKSYIHENTNRLTNSFVMFIFANSIKMQKQLSKKPTNYYIVLKPQYLTDAVIAIILSLTISKQNALRPIKIIVSLNIHVRQIWLF